jgi:hypothetical protein
MNHESNPSVLGCKMYSGNGVTLEAGFYTRGELEQMILMIETHGRMYPHTPIDVIKLGDE